MFIVAAVLVLLFGVVGRITYERTVNTTTPAYAQVSNSGDNGDTGDDSASDGQYESDDGASQGQYDSDDGSTDLPRRDRDLIDSGASGPGPVLTLPDGSCIPEYPNKRNGYCYR